MVVGSGALLAILGFLPRRATMCSNCRPAGRYVRHIQNGRIVSYDILEEHNHRVRRLHFISMVKLPTVIIEVVRHAGDIFAFFQDVGRRDDRAILGLIERPRACGLSCGIRFSEQTFEDANHNAFG